MIYLDEDLDSDGLRQALEGWYEGSVRGVTALVPRGLDDADIVPRLAGEKGCIFVTNNSKDWRFPTAVMEFENSRDERVIAYSLWKVLCARAGLRVVYCYRRRPGEAAGLVRYLRDEVVQAMELKQRAELEGRTVVVVGSRAEAEGFPYDFFHWWRLERNTGEFVHF